MEVALVDITGVLQGLPSTNIDVPLWMNDFDPATSLRTVIFCQATPYTCGHNLHSQANL